MTELEFDSGFLTESQDKLAQKVIKASMIGFELENPPENIIYGLNFGGLIEELEAMKEGKTKKELKKIDKKVKLAEQIYKDKIKVVFNINIDLPKLIYRNIRIPLKISYATVSTWTGVLNFPISNPFIYGRSCARERHKGGTYFFAPFFGEESKLEDLINKIIEKFPESDLIDLIEANFFINILLEYCNSRELKNQLSMSRVVLKSSKTFEELLIKNLNADNNLKHTMRGILHFGAVDTGIFKFKSENDVSTIFIPFRELTVFQVSHYMTGYKKACKAINNLVNNLQKYR